MVLYRMVFCPELQVVNLVGGLKKFRYFYHETNKFAKGRPQGETVPSHYTLPNNSLYIFV